MRFYYDYYYCWYEEFKDTKVVIRIRKSKKDRRHNGQKTDDTMAKRQTTQWPKEKGQKDKQSSTKHTVHIKLKI